MTRVTKGCTARKPASAASASAGPGSAAQPHSAPRARRSSAACTASSVAGWKDETSTRSVQPASSIAVAVERGHRLALVPAGVLGRVLDLDVDQHPVADRERVGEERDVGRQVGHAELADRPEAGDLGVVVDGQAAVGGEPHIELDAVRAAAAGLGEGLERVLGEALRGGFGRLGATPMCPDGCHVVHESSALQVKKFTKTPCTV